MGLYTTVKTGDAYSNCQIKTGEDNCDVLAVGDLVPTYGQDVNLDGIYRGISGYGTSIQMPFGYRHFVVIKNNTIVKVVLNPTAEMKDLEEFSDEDWETDQALVESLSTDFGVPFQQ